MASVTAHTNEFGHQTKLENLPWTGRIDVGDYYTAPESGSSIHLTAYHYRVGRSSNPVQENGLRANSNYRRAIARGYPIASSHEARYPPFLFVRRGHAASTYDSRADLNTYPLSSGYESASENEEAAAVTKALNKLSERKVHFGQYLAESVKSANMIADTAGTLFRDLLAIKRGRGFPRHLRRRFGDYIPNIPDGYLQYKYGWKPLCSDLKNMYDSFGVRDPLRMRLHASSVVNSSYSDNSDTQWWTSRQQNCVVTGRCKIHANVDSEFWRKANQFGLASPLSLGWELVPYSFVVDWAMPVGNFLEGLTAGTGLIFGGAHSSTTIEGSVTGRLKGGSEISGALNGITYRFKSTDRKAFQNFPFPRLYWKSPFSTSNVLSALALWHQLIR